MILASHMFLKEKRDVTIKGRTMTGGENKGTSSPKNIPVHQL